MFYGEAGAYGSWKGEKFKWSSENGDKWDEAKRAEFKQRIVQLEKDRADATEKAKSGRSLFGKRPRKPLRTILIY